MIAADRFDPRNRRISMTLLRQQPATRARAIGRDRAAAAKPADGGSNRRPGENEGGGARRNSLYDIVPRF